MFNAPSLILERISEIRKSADETTTEDSLYYYFNPWSAGARLNRDKCATENQLKFKSTVVFVSDEYTNRSAKSE